MMHYLLPSTLDPFKILNNSETFLQLILELFPPPKLKTTAQTQDYRELVCTSQIHDMCDKVNNNRCKIGHT